MAPSESKPEVKPETSENTKELKSEEKPVSSETKVEVKEEKITPTNPPAEDKKILPKMREIIILTDGNNINLAKNETAGSLELTAVLQTVIGHITSRR